MTCSENNNFLSGDSLIKWKVLAIFVSLCCESFQMKTDKVNTTLHFSFLFCQFVLELVGAVSFQQIVIKKNRLQNLGTNSFYCLFCDRKREGSLLKWTQTLDLHLSQNKRDDFGLISWSWSFCGKEKRIVLVWIFFRVHKF